MNGLEGNGRRREGKDLRRVVWGSSVSEKGRRRRQVYGEGFWLEKGRLKDLSYREGFEEKGLTNSMAWLFDWRTFLEEKGLNFRFSLSEDCSKLKLGKTCRLVFGRKFPFLWVLNVLQWKESELSLSRRNVLWRASDEQSVKKD
jgi:hypothetical protein